MVKQLVNVLALVIIVVAIHALYTIVITPGAESYELIAQQTNSPLPRNIVVILKDLEQEVCLILFFWGFFICCQRYLQITNQSYLFDVDLIEGDRLVPERANDQLEYLNSLEENIKDSALVDILTSSLRRYALTRNIESAANSIEPAIETLSIKNENELFMLKYVSWAIPSIGFLGTVRGIGQAMSQAKDAIGGDITPMTSSLGVAFNSTFVALIVSVILMLFISFIQNLQDQQLVKIKEYVERYLIRRIVHD